MIAVGLFVPVPSTCPAIAVVPWRAPLLVGGATRYTVLMLSSGPLQGGVVNDGLGGGGTSGGVEIVVTVVVSSIWVSGKEMDSWSRRAAPWSRRTVAWKKGTELHLIHKATGDCGIQCGAHCVHSPIRTYGIIGCWLKEP
jgi:hypothetical protein